MISDDLVNQWKREEHHAFKGWDFGHIAERQRSEELLWDYREIVLSQLKKSDRLLDMGTGGGEFLRTLHHPYTRTSVTEAYAPNVALCRQRLEPLGITVAEIFDDRLPFEDGCFDLVINRHSSFDAAEVIRVLRPGGCFITQQVGANNICDLASRLIIRYVPPYPEHTLARNESLLIWAGCDIMKSDEAFPVTRFYDVGALVYFAKAIEWEFPNFSVEESFDGLCQCQKEIEEHGFVQGTAHRFVIMAVKR